jgi:polar amino acid transport system permease protein
MMSQVMLFLPPLLEGAWWTIALSFTAAFGAVAVGLLVCVCKMSQSALLSRPAHIYIEIIRGTPLLLQLFYLYYGLPEVGIVMPAFVAGVLGLSLNFGAYLAELFRAGIQSVDQGQRQAARSLGMSGLLVFYLVVMPQAVRNIFPALGNYALVLVKDSSLVAVISVLELMRAGELLASATFKALEVYTLVGALYLLICFVLSRSFMAAERRLAIPGNVPETAARPQPAKGS